MLGHGLIHEYVMQLAHGLNMDTHVNEHACVHTDVDAYTCICIDVYMTRRIRSYNYMCI